MEPTAPLLVLVASWESIKQAVADVGITVPVQVPERLAKVDAMPTVGQAELSKICEVFRVRIDATADDSFAAIRARMFSARYRCCFHMKDSPY
jgi:hypothetical protein